MTIQQHCRTSLFCHQMCKVAHIILIGCLLVGLSYSSTALATTVDLSEFDSDPVGLGLQKADMLATLSFDITDTSELTLTVDNRTDETFSGQTADMNQVFFSSKSIITGLTYVSATHSVEGDVMSGWAFNALTSKGGLVALTAGTGEGEATHGNGFGVHDGKRPVSGDAAAANHRGPGDVVGLCNQRWEEVATLRRSRIPPVPPPLSMECAALRQG